MVTSPHQILITSQRGQRLVKLSDLYIKHSCKVQGCGIYITRTVKLCRGVVYVVSDPVEKKIKEGKRRKKRLLYLHLKLSSGLVPL